MEIRILGPLEVRTEEGVVTLPRRRERALLVALVLRAGQVVSTDRLVEAIWGDEPPRTAHGSLQNAVSELRKALGHDALRTRAPGYVLDVVPEVIDARRFERALHDAPGLAAAERVEQLTAALALWRGPALADLADEPFARHEAARLDELRLGTVEDRIDAELELGRGPDLVAELEAHVAANPLRERLRGQLMVALYRSGRQAEALEAYQDARRALVEGLGIDPSPALTALERQILRQDPALLASRDAGETAAAPMRAPAVRKTVTVLAATLDGVGGLDPEPLRTLVDRFLQSVRAAAGRHGGTLDRFLGSEAAAVFGVPSLHEDDALRAARAAVELREALGADGIPVRVGIATGEALVDDGDTPVVGDVVSVAIALRETCAPGEILVSPSTRELLGDAGTTGGARRASVRAGDAYPLEAVSGARATPSLPAIPLVGRERELAVIRDALAQATAERRCVAVTALGEAGIGKTRLAAEIAPTLVSGRVLTGRCAPYAEEATFAPVLDLLEGAAGGLDVDALSALVPEGEEPRLAAARIAELATGDPVPRGEAFWAVRTLLEALARDEPLIAVLDDLHWADPTLLDLVEYLAERVDGAVILLCLARPELLDDRAGWGGATSPVSVLHVDPLTDEESRELLEALGGPALASRTRRRLIERAGGNALHLQQLHALLVEQGEAALEAVPSSIEAVLAGRIDRLDIGARTTLQVAAVAGREFTRGLVVALSEPGTPVDASLLELTRRGLVHPERSHGPDDAYRFHHALLRDVAYASLPKTERAQLHEQAAAWLERDAPGSDLLVGHHLEQAHNYRTGLAETGPALDELAGRAADRLFAAGIDAARAGDSAALALLVRSADVAPDDRRRAAALVELAPWLQTVGEVAQKRTVLAEALALAAGIGDAPLEARARVEIGWDEAGVRTERSMQSFGELVRELIPVLEEAGDARGVMRATRFLASVHLYHEQLAEMARAAGVAAAAARRAGWPDDVATVLLITALVHGPTPAPEALRRVEQLLDGMVSRARRAAATSLVATLHAMVGDTEAAHTLAQSSLDVISDLGDHLELIASWFPNRLFMHLVEEERGEALALLAEWQEALASTGNDAYRSTALAERAALIVETECDEADRLLDEAARLASSDDLLVQALLRSIAARRHALDGHHDEARSLAEEAVSVLDATDAVRDRARVMLSRARVLELTGDASEADSAIARARTLFEAKGNLRALQAIDRCGASALV